MNSQINFPKRNRTLFLWAITFIIMGMLIASCNDGPIMTRNSHVTLDTMTIGTHQYLFKDLEKSNAVMCHYEDCTNPVHKR